MNTEEMERLVRAVRTVHEDGSIELVCQTVAPEEVAGLVRRAGAAAGKPIRVVTSKRTVMVDLDSNFTMDGRRIRQGRQVVL